MTFKSDSIVYIQQYVHKLFLLNFLLKIFLKKKKKERLLKIVVMFYSLIQCFFHFIRGLHNIMYLESSVKGNHMVTGKQKKLTFTDNKDFKKNYNPNIRVVHSII